MYVYVYVYVCVCVNGPRTWAKGGHGIRFQTAPNKGTEPDGKQGRITPGAPAKEGQPKAPQNAVVSVVAEVISNPTEYVHLVEVCQQRLSVKAPWWSPSEAVLVEWDRALHTFRGASLSLSLAPSFPPLHLCSRYRHLGHPIRGPRYCHLRLWDPPHPRTG